MSERLKILVVTYGTPYPPNSGVRARDFNLLRQLSGSVHLYLCILTTESQVGDVSALSEFCSRVHTVVAVKRTPIQLVANSIRLWAAGVPLAAHPYFYPELARQVRSIVQTEGIDIVQLEHSLLAGYYCALPPESRCRSVLSLHNVGSSQYRSMAHIQPWDGRKLAYLLKSWLIGRLEARATRWFDQCLVVSHHEAGLLARQVPPGKISIVENGINSTEIQPLTEPPNAPNLLFVGVINYPPNADAVRYFCGSILPLIRQEFPAAQLTVVGHAPPRDVRTLAQTHRVVITGSVPDLTPYYHQAQVCVVPLRAGGGTRLKILEAMAFGRPVVTTSIGSEGLDVIDGVHLLVGDTPEAFAHNVTRLLWDPALRRRIAEAARRRVEERYDWTIIAPKLMQAYVALAKPEPVPQ